MSPHQVINLFKKLSVTIPDPKTELEHSNPFQLLIAVILSAQATDISVNKVTPGLFKAYPDPNTLGNAEVASILKLIRTIGLAPTKAKNIIQSSALLVENHGGFVPNSREALESLPGVGRKTANVILNTLFGQPVIGVDTHIFRVSNRTGLAPGKDVKEVENVLMKVVPKKWKKDAHHLLILHGRYTCKAKNPECPECVIRCQCELQINLVNPCSK